MNYFPVNDLAFEQALMSSVKDYQIEKTKPNGFLTRPARKAADGQDYNVFYKHERWFPYNTLSSPKRDFYKISAHAASKKFNTDIIAVPYRNPSNNNIIWTLFRPTSL